MSLSHGYRFEATQAVRQVLNRAVVWGNARHQPRESRRRQPDAARKEQHPFETWAELETLAAALGARYGPIILFAAATELRPAEWVALEWRDIDRDERVA
jgi:integrase